MAGPATDPFDLLLLWDPLTGLPHSVTHHMMHLRQVCMSVHPLKIVLLKVWRVALRVGVVLRRSAHADQGGDDAWDILQEVRCKVEMAACSPAMLCSLKSECVAGYRAAASQMAAQLI